MARVRNTLKKFFLKICLSSFFVKIPAADGLMSCYVLIVKFFFVGWMPFSVNA